MDFAQDKSLKPIKKEAVKKEAAKKEIGRHLNTGEQFSGMEYWEPGQPNIFGTGLPEPLKAGIEDLSGIRMDDVRVHLNSAEPAQLKAYAYTRGSDIYVGSGQEKYLSHEAWHVVQQKQGRVKATTLAGGVPVNDDSSLEHEADIMGARASSQRMSADPPVQLTKSYAEVVQRVSIFGTDYMPDDIKKITSFYNEISAKTKQLGKLLQEEKYKKAEDLRIEILGTLQERQDSIGYFSHNERRAQELVRLKDALSRNIEIELSRKLYENEEDKDYSGAMIERVRKRALDEANENHEAYQGLLTQIQSGDLHSKANVSRARYVPNSLSVYIRHNHTGYNTSNGAYKMIGDEIEVTFSVTVDENTEIAENKLDLYGIRFDYWENQNQKQEVGDAIKPKLLNSVYTFAPNSTSIQGTQLIEYLGGEQRFQAEPTARLNLSQNQEELRSTLSDAKQNQTQIKFGMRDIPAATYISNNQTLREYFYRDLNFRIAVQDSFGNSSEVFLKQFIEITNGNFPNSYFEIGQVKNADVKVFSLDRQTVSANDDYQAVNTTLRDDSLYPGSYFRKSELGMSDIRSNTLKQKEGEIGFYVDSLKKNRNRLPKINKQNLNRDIKEQQIESSGYRASGGITENVFDCLVYQRVSDTNIFFVGAFIGNSLEYVYLTEINDFSIQLRRGKLNEATMQKLFRDVQYEEIPVTEIWKSLEAMETH